MTVSASIIFGEAFEARTNQEMGGGGSIALINPNIAFAAPIIPSALSFVAEVITKNISFEKPHKVKFTIIDTTDNTIVDIIEGDAPIQSPNPLNTFNFNLSFRNSLFKHEGTYDFIFEMDGEEIGKQSFDIVEVSR